MTMFPLKVPALRVKQPLAEYFVVVLPASVLLQVAYSDRLSARKSPTGEGYELDGTQRMLEPKRVRLITDYINRMDAAFPNTIILAPNLRRDTGFIESEGSDEGDDGADEVKRWSVDEVGGTGWTLTIPTDEKLAAIIDGQHRLFAFVDANESRQDMELICSVFLDLPKPYQAQLFATINSTQKAVPKSQTYELFGYNIEEEPEEEWSPEKLAVYFSRRLHVDDESPSPLNGKITIRALKDPVLKALEDKSTWTVSTAVVVEGILRLITTNPKKDAADLLDGGRKPRSSLKDRRDDKAPLRGAYLQLQDKVLYTLVVNYLKACDHLFWSKASPQSFITRTIGIQALFDVLRRRLALPSYMAKNISLERFVDALAPAGSIDFSQERFQSASGKGRTAIRSAIEEAIDKAEGAISSE